MKIEFQPYNDRLYSILFLGHSKISSVLFVAMQVRVMMAAVRVGRRRRFANEGGVVRARPVPPDAVEGVQVQVVLVAAQVVRLAALPVGVRQRVARGRPPPPALLFAVRARRPERTVHKA